jgi:hypothetical protein
MPSRRSGLQCRHGQQARHPGVAAHGACNHTARQIMQAFLVATGTSALAKIGDKTQSLALLATRFR